MAILIGPFYFKFSCSVVGVFEKYRKLFQIYLIVGIVNAFCLFVTPFYVQGLWSFGPYRYQPLGGPLYFLFTSYFVWCTLHGFILAWKHYGLKRGVDKKHVQLFLYASGIGYGGGFTLFLQGYRIPMPTTGVYLILAYVLIIGYSTQKYKFMDIEVIIKKTLVFTGLFGFLILIAIILSVVVQIFNGMVIDFRTLAAIASTVAIAMIAHDPAKKFLSLVTDKYLFQKTEDFKQILTDLSQTIVAILDLDKVGDAVLHTFSKALHLESGVILLKTQDGKTYKILNAFGFEKPIESMGVNNPIVSYFAESDKIVNLDLDDDVPDFIRKAMNDFKARVIVPLFFQSQLIGLLMLGKKKSDQEYTRQEMEYFPAISAQVAVALSNADAIELLKKNQIELAQQSKLAALGTLSAGIGHEIQNPLQSILSGFGMLKVWQEFGKFEGMSKQEIIDAVLDAGKRMEKDAERISKIIENLRRYSVKSQAGEREQIDLHENINNALDFFSARLKNKCISVRSDYDKVLPKVFADPYAMDNVFLNLMKNAMDAIELKKHNEESWISIKTVYSDADKLVRIELADSGSGIKEEHHEKLFVPFFTTKDISRNPDGEAIRGTGLGLHIIKQIIENHGGQVSFKSQAEKGTTFFISLPAANII